MKKYYYGYEEFIKDTKELSKQLKAYEPDTLLAVARGGLTLGHFIAQALDTRRLFALNSIHYEKEQVLDTIEVFNIPNLSDAKKVVIIDDIVDSGVTIKEVLAKLQTLYPNCEFKIATIFYKPTAVIKADFALKEATQWIDFFWEVDPLI